MSTLPFPAHPLRIFIVEDHRIVREALTAYLEGMGHTVVSAAGMIDALDKLPDALCHVLISDIDLPDGDGWELLKQSGLARSIFAVAMTGAASDAHGVTSKAVGYRYHLRKPFDPRELNAALEQAAREIAEQQ